MRVVFCVLFIFAAYVGAQQCVTDMKICVLVDAKEKTDLSVFLDDTVAHLLDRIIYMPISASQGQDPSLLPANVTACHVFIGEHIPSVEAHARKTNKLYLLTTPPSIILERRMQREPDEKRTMFSIWPSWGNFFKESLEAAVSYKQQFVAAGTGYRPILGNILIVTHDITAAYLDIVSELVTTLILSPHVTSVRHIAVTVKPDQEETPADVLQKIIMDGPTPDGIVYMFDRRGKDGAADIALLKDVLYQARESLLQYARFFKAPYWYIWDMTAFTSDRLKHFLGVNDHDIWKKMNIKMITIDQCQPLPQTDWDCNAASNTATADKTELVGRVNAIELVFHFLCAEGFKSVEDMLARFRKPNFIDATVGSTCFGIHTMGRAFQHGFRIYASADVVSLLPVEKVTPNRENGYHFPECKMKWLAFYMKTWNEQTNSTEVATHRNIAGMKNGTTVDKTGQRTSEDKTRIVVVLEPPFAFKIEGGGVETTKYRGITVELVQKAMERLMMKTTLIKYEFYVAPNNTYGTLDETSGTYTGALGEVQAKKADLAIGMFSKTRQRERTFDFSASFEYVGITVITLKEDDEATLFGFSRPFDTKVWWALIAVLFLAAFFIRLLEYWNPFMDEVDPEQRFNMKESVWYSFGAITQAGSAFAPVMHPVRVFSAFYWFFALVVCACYTGNLASFLTEVRSLDETELKLTSATDYSTFETLPDSYMQTFINDISKEKNIPSLATNLGFTPTYTEGIKRLREAGKEKKGSAKYLLIGEDVPLQYYAARDKDCSLVVSSVVVGHTELAFPMLKDYEWHEWKADFFNELQEMKNDGTMGEISQRFLKYETKCEIDEDDDDGVSLDFYNLGGLYIVLGVFMVVAFIVNLIKLAWLKYCRRKKDDESEEPQPDVTLEEGPAAEYDNDAFEANSADDESEKSQSGVVLEDGSPEGDGTRDAMPSPVGSDESETTNL